MIKDEIKGLSGLSSFQKDKSNLTMTTSWSALSPAPQILVREIIELSEQSRIQAWLIGMRLKKLKELFQDDIKCKANPNWKDWVDDTFNYSHTWTDKLINLFERFNHEDLKSLPEDRSKQLEIARISDNKKRHEIIEMIAGKDYTLSKLKKMISDKIEDSKPIQKATQVASKEIDTDELLSHFSYLCIEIKQKYIDKNLKVKHTSELISLLADMLSEIKEKQ